MDHFPKCFLIIQLHAEAVQDGALSCDQDDRRGWRAVRLDLVAPPADRFAYALLGWSGSTVGCLWEGFGLYQKPGGILKCTSH